MRGADLAWCRFCMEAPVADREQQKRRGNRKYPKEAWILMGRGKPKINVAPKNIHALFFLVVGEEIGDYLLLHAFRACGFGKCLLVGIVVGIVVFAHKFTAR